ncbi:hypothetical protein CRYUN_Cryun17cG0045400 [Craigia yunnanensis]
MASTACFLHHHALTTASRSSSSQRQVATIKPNQLVTVLIGAAAVGSKVSPADAAYGEAANVFGKPKTNRVLTIQWRWVQAVTTKWNPSKEVEYPGQVLRYEDNFDSTTNVGVMITPTDKKSITDFGSPEEFLSKVGYLFGKQAYSGLTDSEGGFDPNAVASANILETLTPLVCGKQYYLSVLTRTANGDEGGKHQLITATVNGGKLYICKAQVGDEVV